MGFWASLRFPSLGYSVQAAYFFIVVSAPAVFSRENRAPVAFIMDIANVLPILSNCGFARTRHTGTEIGHLHLRRQASSADPAYRDRKLNGYGGLVALVAEGCPYLNILVYVI